METSRTNAQYKRNDRYNLLYEIESIHYFPIVHNVLCLPPKFCINYCCEILLGDLHIPKSIPQQQVMQNLGGKQSALWGIRKQKILYVALIFIGYPFGVQISDLQKKIYIHDNECRCKTNAQVAIIASNILYKYLRCFQICDVLKVLKNN